MQVLLKKAETYRKTGVVKWRMDKSWFKQTKKGKRKVTPSWYHIRLENIQPEAQRKELVAALVKLKQSDVLKLEAEYNRESKTLDILGPVTLDALKRQRTTIESLIYEMNLKNKDSVTAQINISFPVKGTYEITVQKLMEAS